MTLEEIGKGMKERISDPLFGSFALSFVITNWRFFYVLATSDDAPKRAMDAAYNLREPDGVWILVPVAAALIYTLVYPWVRAGIVALRRLPGLVEENVLNKINRRGSRITVAELHEHREFKDQGKQIDALLQALHRIQAADGALHEAVGNTPLMELREVDDASPDWEVPVLLAENPRTHRLERVTVNSSGPDLWCGYQLVGASRILAVRNHGIVPIGVAKGTWLVFMDGRAARADKKPSLAALQSIPGHNTWGKFSGVG